jgi:hypothetical protein
MAMLKTMTKEAGEPKGSPAGKAAPADKAPAGKTSPEAIRAGLHLQPKEAAQLDRIVLAGRKVMFAKQSHKMFLEQLDGPGDIAQKLGQGVAGLMGLLWQESRRSLPPQLLIPSGMVLVAVAADFLRKGGMEVTDEDVAGGIEALVTALLQAGGVDPEKVAQIGERGGKSDGTMPAPKTGEAAEGEA